MPKPPRTYKTIEANNLKHEPLLHSFREVCRQLSLDELRVRYATIKAAPINPPRTVYLYVLEEYIALKEGVQGVSED
jgi:hypothetical protein